MKFFIAMDDREATLNCFTTMREAKACVRDRDGTGSVQVVDVPVTAESIRALLSGWGGYATTTREVEVK